MTEFDKRIRTFPKNLAIIREAEEGSSIFFMMKGRATVFVEGREVHDIGPGEFFGEIAAILGLRRTATVRAREFCETYEFNGLDDEGLMEFLRARPPEILKAFLRGMASKLVDSSRLHAGLIKRQEEQIRFLEKAISGTLAVIEGVLRKSGPQVELEDVGRHLRELSGMERGDVREIEPSLLPHLRTILYRK